MSTISNFLVVGAVVVLWTFVLSLVVAGAFRIGDAIITFLTQKGE